MSGVPNKTDAPKGLQDPGLRWFYRYLTRYVFKHQSPLMIVHVCTFGTCIFSAVVILRALVWTPDVGMTKGSLPWENLSESYQFQLMIVHVCTFGTVIFSFVVLFRAFKTPDVWATKRRLPWENMPTTHQFQFYSPNIRFKDLKHEGRPEI